MKSGKMLVISVVTLLVALPLATLRGSTAGTGHEILQRHQTTKFEFFSGNPSYDEAYNLAMAEVLENIENGQFIAGAGWTQLWTRDTSYAVELAAGLIHPEVSKTSLEACTEEVGGIGTVWLQDKCGHFDGWPNLSDAIVGAQGAWAYYVMTGDSDFLEWSYIITKNSLIRAERDVFDEPTGLFRGCSSFMESNSGYPSKYHSNGTLVGMTKALSTNILHYNGYKLGSMMGAEVGAPSADIEMLNDKAAALKSNIRSHLWLPERGYYSYFEDEDGGLMPQMEGLGESLALLAPDFENDSGRISSMFRNVHRSDRGIPCLWPRFDIDETGDSGSYYHNGRIWPFVQGYWAMAAAAHGEADVFAHEFENLLHLSQINSTFAEFYELDGTFLERRRRQLWSDVGFLSMVFRGLFGMVFSPTGITFRPTKPASPFADTISLKRVMYRKMTFDLFVEGSGSIIKSFKLNGSLQSPVLPASLTGNHKVEITLEDSDDGMDH